MLSRHAKLEAVVTSSIMWLAFNPIASHTEEVDMLTERRFFHLP